MIYKVYYSVQYDKATIILSLQTLDDTHELITAVSSINKY